MTSGQVVVCNQGGPIPVQGRVMCAGFTSPIDGSSQGGYIAADGDADNYPKARGWARVDIYYPPYPTPGPPKAPEVRCGGHGESGGTDAASPTGGTVTNHQP